MEKGGLPLPVVVELAGGLLKSKIWSAGFGRASIRSRAVGASVSSLTTSMLLATVLSGMARTVLCKHMETKIAANESIMLVGLVFKGRVKKYDLSCRRCSTMILVGILR